MGAAATPATRALDAAGVAYALHAFTHDPASEGFGPEAVEALGVDGARVLKTLVAVTADGGLVLGILPVPELLDLKRLAGAVGAKRAALADVRVAERATGYVHGGISPFGQRRRLPAVVDATAATHERVIVNAGRRGLQAELAPADLIALTAAKVATIVRGR